MPSFSYNLWSDSFAFDAGRLLLFAAIALGTLRLSMHLSSKTWVRVTGFVGGTAAAFTVVWALRPFGDVDQIHFVGDGPQRYVSARFSRSRAGKASGNLYTLRTFGLRGQRIGGLAEAAERGSARPTTVFDDGGIRIMRSGEQHEIFTSRTLRSLGKIERLIASRVQGPFQLTPPASRSLGVRLPNGEQKTFALDDLLTLVPPPAPNTVRAADDLCRATTTRAADRGGLLRASLVDGPDCRYAFAGVDGQLVLHRSTAFGEGAYLLSATTESGTVWTTPLDELLDGATDLEVVAPEATDTTLVVWLLRDARSLSRLHLDAATGTPRAHHVIF